MMETSGAGKQGNRAGGGIGARLRNARKTKVILLAVVLAAALTAGLCVLRGPGEAALPVNVTPVVRQAIQERLSLTGPVSGTDSVDVVSNIHAEITAMHVKEGDRVVKGQVLAELDRTDLEREAKLARNRYEIALANLSAQNRTAALGYEKAAQDLAKAQLDYERNSQLFAAGAISQAEMEQLANAVNDARRAAEGYTTKDGRGTADPSFALQVQNAACELERAEEELSQTQIKSAIAGTVVRVNSKVGQFADKVADDKPILSIENLERLELEIQVSEFSIGKLRIGQKAEISADILNGEPAEGEVTSISPTGEEKGGGSTERVIPTTIRIDGNDSRLIAGITAKARILVDQAEDALVVPAGAVWEEGEESFVAVAEDGLLRRVPVTVGVDGDILLQVIPREEEELTEGMLVVTEPDPQMAEGTRIQAVPEGGDV